jgi:PAS domain S-box-containing protein
VTGPATGEAMALDRVGRLAARVLAAASGVVSLRSDDRPGSPCRLPVTAGEPLVVTDATADRRTAGLPDVADGTVGACLGVPLVTSAGETVGALCVTDPRPRAWSEQDVALLDELATFAVAELERAALATEVEASRTRSELAIDAAGIGSFDWDLATGRLAWDDRLIDLFGYTRADFADTIEAFNARLHPDDLPRVRHLLEESIASCGSYEAEYRVVRPDGETRWVEARGVTLCDEAGRPTRVLGAAYDTTAVRAGEARVARVLESMSAAFFALDRAWRFTYVNAEAERVLGRSRDELIGGAIWDLFPATAGSDFEFFYRRAVETGRPETFEAYYPAPLDAWYEVRAWPGPDGLSVYFLDISDRRAAQEQVERAAMRAGLLADVASELAGTLDAEEAVARLSRLVVPALADWCIVTLVEGDGETPDWRRIRDIGCWHVDPGRRELVERYAAVRKAALTERSFLGRALATGRRAVISSGATEAIEAVLAPGEARALLRELAPETAAVLPLRAHGRTLGLLTLFSSAASPHPAHRDVSAAAEVAARAGLALDNARLYAEQRRLAEALQRSLLTAPPEPDHMHVVVRYEPATEVAQVGGDWYDAFLQRDGAMVLVIGDVVGHDTEAAAAMGQVRGLLRGIAATTGDGPAAVLARLDAAMELLEVGTTATAVVARFEQTADERCSGVTRLRWSSAGHPPPIAIAPDGTVTVLTGPVPGDADLLLGIDPETGRTECEVALDRGSTVLLYTDGLVERRGQSLDEGLARLTAALRELAGRELDDLCDEVVARLLPERPDDDVAIAAVRLHPQDHPRPPEAGPGRAPDAVPDE